MERAALELEYAARSLFRRCVQCPGTQPACACGPNEMCKLNPGNCNQCPSTTCIPNSSTSTSGSGSSGSSSGSSPIGPIVGGVVGGIVAIAAAVFLVYWFWIRPRKRRAQEEEWEDENIGIEKDGMNQLNVGIARDPRRTSTRTVGSVASTIATRASNVIQIAYIPGVTNRSMHSSPELVPPVPPIPAASGGNSAINSPQPDQHYFMPDLRQSSYSDLSDRTSMTRGSVTSTVYRNDAVVNPLPAQAVTRMKPTAVSVKSSSKNTPNLSRSASPPVPTSTYSTSAGSSSNPTRQATLNTKSSIVGKFAQPKAITVTRKGSTTLRPFKQGFCELDDTSSRSVSPLSSQRNTETVTSPQYSHHSTTFRDGSESDEEDDEVYELAGQGLMSRDNRRSNNAVHEVPASPLSVPSYSRSPELGGPSSNMHKRNSSLGKVIEEATRRAAQTHMPDYVSHAPERSPFSDENATTTP